MSGSRKNGGSGHSVIGKTAMALVVVLMLAVMLLAATPAMAQSVTLSNSAGSPITY